MFPPAPRGGWFHAGVLRVRTGTLNFLCLVRAHQRDGGVLLDQPERQVVVLDGLARAFQAHAQRANARFVVIAVNGGEQLGAADRLAEIAGEAHQRVIPVGALDGLERFQNGGRRHLGRLGRFGDQTDEVQVRRNGFHGVEIDHNTLLG
jgi:hypothetical protein